MAFFLSVFRLFNCPPFFVFPPFAGVCIERWHGGFQPFSPQVWSMQWFRDAGSVWALTCLQFCFRAGKKPAAFVSIEIFQTFIGGFGTFFFFFSFAVAVLWFAFCSVVAVLLCRCIRTDAALLWLLLCSSFLLFKDVLTWHFSCSWAHSRFVVFVFLSFFDSLILLLVAVWSIFGCDHFCFLTRWCWVLILGEFNAFFFSVSPRMNRHFPSCSRYKYLYSSMKHECFCADNKDWGDRNMHLWLTCYFTELLRW